MSFIFINNDLDEIKEEFLDIEEPPSEYAWDINTEQFIIDNGCIPIVEGIEAIKIWIHKCLKTVRGKFDAYNWDYGQDVSYLVEQNYTRDYTKSEAKRMTEEALLKNKYILSLQDLEVDIRDRVLCISFTAITNYGNLDIRL